MTWDTKQKRHLLRRWKECYQHTYPSNVTVHIRDFMPEFKVSSSTLFLHSLPP